MSLSFPSVTLAQAIQPQGLDTTGPDAWHRFWLGPSKAATPEAASTELIYMGILWVNIISFVLLMALMFYFVFKYHRSKQATNYQTSASHNTPLELAWSIIPLIVMVPMFWYGMKGYVNKLAAPSDSEEITIRGQKWQWFFTYRNGAEPQPTSDIWKPVAMTRSGAQNVPVFAVPAGRPVRLIMTSSDVIHSFYIPDFRMKMDVIPNRYTSMWFQADRPSGPFDPSKPVGPGNEPGHRIYCAEYCGDLHSEMGAYMRVVPAEEYERLIRQWTDLPGTLDLMKAGEILRERKGCIACHSIDGTKGTGPTWKNIYKYEQPLSNGPTVTAEQADENYIRESILNPGAKLVAGYPNNMPSYQGQLKPRELDILVMYIKALSDKAEPAHLERMKRTIEEDAKAESSTQN
jgi:cytochrome c oxidase subunit 2